MKYSKTFIGSLLVSLLFVAGTVDAKTQANTGGLSISDIVELLINLDIISDDKADQAREAIADIDSEDIAEVKEDNPNKTIYNNCPYGQFKKALQIGEEGEEVTMLQKFLASEKDIYPEGKVTGYYGPLTERAVKKYQEKYGVEAVGIVGPQTRAKLNARFTECEIQKRNQAQVKNQGDDDAEEEEEEEEGDDDNESTTALESITLSVVAGKEKVAWDVDGKSVKGFKVVWSKESGPEYPTRDGDKEVLAISTRDGSKNLDAFDGTGTYYVRVCEYLGSSKCGMYSNEVTLTLTSEDDDEDTVTEITLTADEENGEVTWESDGVAEDGFKVVWSKESGPTYPTRDSDEYEHLTSSDADSAELDAFDGTGTYYVRVCNYLDGACGVYSNEVTLAL